MILSIVSEGLSAVRENKIIFSHYLSDVSHKHNGARPSTHSTTPHEDLLRVLLYVFSIAYALPYH